MGVLRGGGILTAEGPNWLPSSAPSGHRLQRELAVSKPIGTARRAAPSPPKLRITGRRAGEFSARRSLRGPGHHVTGDLTRWTRPGPWRRERHEPPRVSAARPADVLEPGAAAGSSARPGRKPGVWAEHRPPGFQVQRRAALAASLPLLLFRPGGTWASAGLQVRADHSSVWRGRNCPWSPAVYSSSVTLCPWTLCPCTAGPRACPKSTPVCQARTSCPPPCARLTKSPLENTPEGGALGQVKRFLSKKRKKEKERPASSPPGFNKSQGRNMARGLQDPQEILFIEGQREREREGRTWIVREQAHSPCKGL